MKTRLTLQTSADSVGNKVPVRVGVPMPRAAISTVDTLNLSSENCEAIPQQCNVLERWPDASVKWMLMDALIPVSNQEMALTLSAGAGPDEEKSVDAVNSFHAESPGSSSIVSIVREKGARKYTCEVQAVLQDRKKREWQAVVTSAKTVADGPVCTTTEIEARFERDSSQLPLNARFEVIVYPVPGLVSIEADILNPEAAYHPGNVWDLGDPGSFLFQDLSVRLQFPEAPSASVCATRRGEALRDMPCAEWSIYQDSSGGENWDSPNHVDSDGRSTVSFPGFRLIDKQHGGLIEQGDRADPVVAAAFGGLAAGAYLDRFWQNFPSSIRVSNDGIEVGLFAGECAALFELQGGERKRQRVLFSLADDLEAAAATAVSNDAVKVWIDPEWIQKCRVLPWFTSGKKRHDECDEYVKSIVDGELSFERRREVIDEFGWRNFGDLYADHEAVHEKDKSTFISHYNNQYDFVYGAAIHALRDRDLRWWRLMEDAAKHHIDIDIYHTREDRPAYNGGLFWHTEHYRSAGLATHRTYSNINKTGRDFGGGPSNEHNYTSGLTLYHLLSGDPIARESVIGLADWVLAMDDGATTIWSIVDPKTPTGLASRTKSDDYHGAGRGAGNSVNALLDAHCLTAKRQYLEQAEALIRRCVHPEDCLNKLQLDSPEDRWSYLVFLQVLGKYLWTKEDLAEFDFHYYYAKDCLLHYADWVLLNEELYSKQFDKVDLPTETWPAQDIRKAHVLFIASTYAIATQQVKLQEKAEYFFQGCLRDVLKFDTAYLCRPRVLLAVYGYARDYFVAGQTAARPIDSESARSEYSYESRPNFVPQRANLGAALRTRISTLKKEVGRQLPVFLRVFAKRLKSPKRKSQSGEK